MSSPHDIMSAYSQGRIGQSEAIRRLKLHGALDLLIAMADSGHPLPRPTDAEVRIQVAEALPLLRAALRADGDAHA